MHTYVAAADETETVYHDHHDQFLPNCTSFTFNQLKTFNLAMGISGAACLLMSIIILVFLLCVFKAYKSTLQRLIIYNALLTVLYQFGNVLQLEHQFSYNGQSTVCSILGAFYMYIANVTFLFAAVIITYLLYLVLQLCFKGSLSHSKVANCLVEFLCTFIPFILPFFFLWTPFLHNGFGLGGFYCWIKDVDSNCTSYYTDLIVMYSVSEATSLEMLVSSGVVFTVYCRMRTKVKQKHMHTLIQKTCFLVSFHAVSFAIGSVAFGVVFYLLLKGIFLPNQPLMFSVAIVFPFTYEFALLVLFIVSLRTSNSSARPPQQEPRHRVHWDNEISSKDMQTRPAKLSFLTQPSTTVSQSVPYTGEFDTNDEKVMLTSSADHPNANYEATSNQVSANQQIETS